MNRVQSASFASSRQHASAGFAPSTLLGSITSGTARGDATWLTKGLAVLFVTALTAAAAQISVPLPFTPVPFTFQPMVVLIGGAALGARLGMASQVLYLLIGLAGLPVFAASPLLPQGAARLLGPTAGFLLSYPLAAWLTGRLAERQFDRKYLTSVLAMAAGLLVIYTGGMLRLAYGPPQSFGLFTAFQVGIAPFIPADIVKIFLAAGVLPGVWKFLGKQGR
jgi:biotin transport system substrate-specific component